MDLNNYFDGLNSKKHGFSKSEDFEKYSLYRCYINILARCRNENHPRYADYGGRGIPCHFESFEAFARGVGLRPSSGHSIDRIDNDRGYEPGNVRWATDAEQSRNRRAPRPYKKRTKPTVRKPTLH
ncbi:hypothetical protein D3C80_1804970 [compost metagenome]